MRFALFALFIVSLLIAFNGVDAQPVATASTAASVVAPAAAPVVASAAAPVVTAGRSNYYLNILDLIGLRLDRGLLPALLGGSQHAVV